MAAISGEMASNDKNVENGLSTLEFLRFALYRYVWIRLKKVWPPIQQLSLWLEVHALPAVRESGREYARLPLPDDAGGEAATYRIRGLEDTLASDAHLTQLFKDLGIRILVLDVRLESNQISDVLAQLHAWRRRIGRRGRRLRGGAGRLFGEEGLQMSCARVLIQGEVLTLTYSYCMTNFSRLVKWFEDRHPRFKDHRAVFIAAPRYALISAAVAAVPFIFYVFHGSLWLLLAVTILGALGLFFMVYLMLMMIGSIEYDNEEKAYRLEVAYRKLKQYADGVREDMSRARGIQEKLLPDAASMPMTDHLDWASSFAPQSEVGGDYFDVTAIGEKRVGMLFADVSGHGMSAALVTVLLKVAFEGWEERPVPLETFAADLNKLLHRVTPQKSFAAAVLACYDTETGILSYINCGHHPAPLLLKPGEKIGISSLDQAGAMIMGVFPQGAFSEARLKLEPGDTVLMTTDGVTEAADEDGEMFGQERLQSYLQTDGSKSPRELVAGLVETVDAFTGSAYQNDDRMVLAFRVRT
jgi:serine phosphatase RsbU (regulator of sigma subunit)